MREYKVGDQVKIRSWDDMAREFKYRDITQDCIAVECGFTKEMKCYCDKIYTIERITVFKNYALKDIHSFVFSKDMFVEKIQSPYEIEE